MTDLAISDSRANSWTSFLVRHRVPISLGLFAILIFEDVVCQTPPKHGWLRDAAWPGICGAALVVVGLAIRSWAAGVLPKGIDLATTGPYSLCRHPLYLGSWLMMLGFCMVIGYVHDYLVILGPIALIYLLTMKAEEQRMLQKYGSRWTNYAVVTPRLLPLKAMNYTAAPWSPARWSQRREYRAIVTALAGLGALEWWRLSSDVF